MTRLVIAGGEFGSLDAAVVTPEGLIVFEAGATNPVIDTTVKRSGTASIKCAGTASFTSAIVQSFSVALGVDAFARAWLRLSAYPAAGGKACLVLGATATDGALIKMDATGHLGLFTGAGGTTQIGSYTADPAPLDTWFCLEVRARSSSTAGQDQVEAYLRPGEGQDRVAIGGPSSGDYISGGLGSLFLGWVVSPGVASNIWLDDIAVNDGGGAAPHNTWPVYDARVVITLPNRLVAAGAWVTCKNTAAEADFVDALDNFPPLGEADATNHITAHQVRSASTSPTDKLDLECRSYGRMGVPGNLLVEPATATTRSLGDATANTRQAQRLYLAGAIDHAEVTLAKVGSPSDNATLEVQSDSAGAPSGAVLATLGIAGSGLSTTAGWVSFAPLVAALTPGTPYWLVLSRSGAVDAANYYKVGLTAANTYYDGGVAAHNGTSWGAVDRGNSWAFRAYNQAGYRGIVLIQPICAHAEAVSTGTKTGSLALVNPTASGATLTFGGDAGAAGAYPTNWRWKLGALVSEPPGVVSTHAAPRVTLTKTDGTNRVALCAALAAMLEYLPGTLGPGWQQFAKTSDSSLWWGKQASSPTTGYYDNAGVETAVPCQAGDWFLTSDPLPAEGVMPTNLTTTTDADLKAGYTPV